MKLTAGAATAAGTSDLAFSRFPGRPSNRRPSPFDTHLILGGDVMLSRHVARVAREQRDPAFPLRDLAPVLQAADIAFVNLESPFSDRGAVVERGMIFKAEPEMIAALELAGVDVVSTANNHARDQGSHGVEFTLDWLERHQIAVAGTGSSAEAAHAGVVIERNGIRFGFLAYTYDQSNGNHTDIGRPRGGDGCHPDARGCGQAGGARRRDHRFDARRHRVLA